MGTGRVELPNGSLMKRLPGRLALYPKAPRVGVGPTTSRFSDARSYRLSYLGRYAPGLDRTSDLLGGCEALSPLSYKCKWGD